MDHVAIAQKTIENIQAGKVTREKIEAQMAQMEAALDRGAEVIGLKVSPAEAREGLRVMREALATLDAVDTGAAPTVIDCQAAVTLRHTPQDALLDALDHTQTMRVTTQHAASSYGQPVVMRPDGTLVDYAAIASLHLLGSSAGVAAQVAQALAPFGIRSTWQARSADPTEA